MSQSNKPTKNEIKQKTAASTNGTTTSGTVRLKQEQVETVEKHLQEAVDYLISQHRIKTSQALGIILSIGGILKNKSPESDARPPDLPPLISPILLKKHIPNAEPVFGARPGSSNSSSSSSSLSEIPAP